MARNLFAILDDMTANLAELKAALAPLALIGGTVVAEAGKPATAKRRAKLAATGARGPISAKRRAAMRVQGQYMSAIRLLSAAQRAQVKKLRAAKGAEAAIKLARKLSR
jgi:multidrug efflux pump subunit AcrA (membrane-fusion protein)